MAIFTGASAPGIWKGREDLGIHLGSAEAGIVVGSAEAGIVVGGGGAALKWANFAAGAYAEMSAADTQLIEDAYDASGGDICYYASWEADLSLGAPTVGRSPFSFSTSVDTNGTLMSMQPSSGRMALLFWDDGGLTVANGWAPPGVYSLFSGDEDFVQWFDLATGTTGVITAQVDTEPLAIVDATYDRTRVGVFDRFAVSGWTRGPIPTVQSIKGWSYFTIVVTADTSGIAATIAADVAAATSQMAKYNAVLAALVAGGFASSIVFAQAFDEGSAADYGDSATIVGATYSEAEGVP